MRAARYAIVWALEMTCTVLDAIPTWEWDDGRLRHFKSGWGCRVGVARWAFALGEHWGVW